MSITLEPFELRAILREDRKLTVKAVLAELGMLKATINQSEARKRGVSRDTLRKWESDGVLTRIKRGEASNSKVEYDLVQFEEALRTQRSGYTIK